MITEEQRKVAETLLLKRPPVVAGTRAIINRKQASDWHEEVSAEMRRLGVRTPEDVNEFCNVAGVAD